MICIYLWFLGLNVYAWNKFHINYKLCFAFGNHHSELISIFKRAAVFSAIFVLMTLAYMLIRTQIPIVSNFFIFIPLEMTPLICWLSLLVYLLMPYKDYFNYIGRMWSFKLIAESVACFVVKLEFKHIWLTDQLTSFIGPMRDIEYTICYYYNYNSTANEKQNLCSSNRSIVLFLGIFPHILRIFQVNNKKLSI